MGLEPASLFVVAHEAVRGFTLSPHACLKARRGLPIGVDTPVSPAVIPGLMVAGYDMECGVHEHG